MFFHAYMYGPLQGKLRLYNAREVHPPGAAMSSDWEVFASILVKDLGKKLAAGIDLGQHEVKSAFAGGSYEYQYHKNTGKKKLKKGRSGWPFASITGIICVMLIYATPMGAR